MKGSNNITTYEDIDDADLSRLLDEQNIKSGKDIKLKKYSSQMD